MDYITITKEQFTSARSYVPQAEKIAFVEGVATKCFDVLNISGTDSNDAMAANMPPMYKENTFAKARFLMGALLKMYLGVDFEPVEGETYLVSQDDYDRYAGGHILNQIERFKSDTALRDKSFDLLQDYRDIEKRLNTEIYGLLQCMNDPTSRLLAALSQSAREGIMQTNMEDLRKLQTQLESIRGDLEQRNNAGE